MQVIVGQVWEGDKEEGVMTVCEGGKEEGVMTAKILTTILDIILSLVVVGIPERAQSSQHERGADNLMKEESCDTQNAHECGSNGACCEAGRRERNDSLEALLLDGTVALNLAALLHAPWRVLYYLALRLPRCQVYIRVCACVCVCVCVCVSVCECVNIYVCRNNM
jgi:hypothetical protein